MFLSSSCAGITSQYSSISGNHKSMGKCRLAGSESVILSLENNDAKKISYAANRSFYGYL